MSSPRLDPSSEPPTGPHPTRWWLWLLGAALCALTVTAVFQVFVGSRTGQMLEYRAFQAVEPDPQGTFEPTLATMALRHAPAVALGCAALGALVRLGRGHLQSAAAVLAAAAGANVTTQLLKHGLERPFFDNGVPYAAGNSLPSGHATLAATAAMVLLLTAPVRGRPAAALGGASLTAAICAAAYLEAWHRPSDMVAAVAVAAGWGFLAAPFVHREDGLVTDRTTAVSGPELLLWGAGVLGVVASAVLLGTASPPAEAGPPPAPTALAAGLVLSVAPSLLAWAALLTCLRRERRWARRRARRQIASPPRPRHRPTGSGRPVRSGSGRRSGPPGSRPRTSGTPRPWPRR